jgi:hypothetical protein
MTGGASQKRTGVWSRVRLVLAFTIEPTPEVSHAVKASDIGVEQF